MDWFNKKALKLAYADLGGVKSQLAEAQHEISLYMTKVATMTKEIEALDAKLRGDRVRGGYCVNCKHAFSAMGALTCELDCKCKDFEGKDG